MPFECLPGHGYGVDPPTSGDRASLPTPTKRTRTAQGFNPATGDASYASFYRENKVSQSEFAAALVAARAAYNIRPEDYCGWTDAGPSGKTCQEHFNDD